VRKAFYVSGNRNLPDTVGIVPLSDVTYIGLCSNKVWGFRPVFDKEKPGIDFKQIFVRWAAYWRRPARFGGGAEDGNTAELVAALQDGLDRQLPDHPQQPLNLFANIGNGWRFNWCTDTVNQLILGVGPGKKGVAPLQPLSPGGRVEAVEADHKHTYISFGDKGVLELPPTTRLYPWVVEGADLDDGVPLGDYIPRDEYTVEQFNSLPDSTKKVIAACAVKTACRVYDGQAVVPVSMVLPEDRKGLLSGGRIKSLFAYLEPRKLYITQSDDIVTDYGVSKLS
jgi:hypothetical protein